MVSLQSNYNKTGPRPMHDHQPVILTLGKSSTKMRPAAVHVSASWYTCAVRSALYRISRLRLLYFDLFNTMNRLLLNQTTFARQSQLLFDLRPRCKRTAAQTIQRVCSKTAYTTFLDRVNYSPDTPVLLSLMHMRIAPNFTRPCLFLQGLRSPNRAPICSFIRE